MKHDFNQVIDRRNTYSTQWDFTADRFGRPDVLPFSISDTDFLSPAPIVESVTQAASRGQFGYTRWNHSDYKDSIVNWFSSRYEAQINPNWIAYAPSVMYSVALLVRLICLEHEQKGAVVTFGPHYDSFPGALSGNGAELRVVDLLYQDDHYEIDWLKLEEALVGARAFVLCSPHNPTGRVWEKIELDRLIELLTEHDISLISDEIHADILRKGKKHISAISYADTFDNICVCSSPSKIFNTAALGSSYALIANKDLYNQFMNHTRHVDFVNSASLMGILGTIVGYNQCAYYADDLCAYIDKNFDVLSDGLARISSDIKLIHSEGTYLAWIDMQKYLSEHNISMANLHGKLINQAHIGIMNGATYGAAGEGFLRMCIGCPSSKITEGIKRLERVL